MNEQIQLELKNLLNSRFSTSESTRANYARGEDTYDPVLSKAVVFPETNEEVSKQGSRCMDCGIPYCHQGCPVNNLIPDWNDLVYKHEWKKALDTLHSTNNFPEFTGRICPAPCEAACTLNLTDNPVSIKTIECSIVDYGWEKGWIKPQLPKKHTDKKVAIIGSGPAGLACADVLARKGIKSVVYDKYEEIGGLLTFGIPPFKLEKEIVLKRRKILEGMGVEFKLNIEIGKDISFENIYSKYDAVFLGMGTYTYMKGGFKGEDLDGVYDSLPYLNSNIRRLMPVSYTHLTLPTKA